jgi:hypothetical protein
MHLLFLEAALSVSKEPDGHEFLVSEERFSVITQALKTSHGRSIVNLADKQVDLNQLIFHRKKIISSYLFVCLFNY